MKSIYKVITASAGSGKTYTLVRKLLLICLAEPHRYTIIQNILALTFTNKAANEMKERILGWLHNFSKEEYRENKDLLGIQQELKNNGKEVSVEELHRRAQQLRDFILHNYSVLNIGTIDKFNAKLVRSFAYELGLAKNFNLEINPEPFLIEAVDQTLEKVGEDPLLSEEFIDFVMYNLDSEKKINLSKELFNSAEKYLQDIHYEQLQENSKFCSNEYKQASKVLQQSIKALKKEIQALALRAMEFVEQKGVEVTDFSGGMKSGLLSFFINILNKGEIKLRGSAEEEQKTIDRYRKGVSPSAKKAGKEESVLSITEPLLALRQEIIQKQVQILKEEKILRGLLPLKINQNIQQELQNIESEKDLVLLSKFNIIINQNLEKEPAEFIYEKVGTRYQHFFFDEFQDTSYLQWKNIIPLRDESLSQEHTSFTIVGDPKQSIYRFRGGDSQIMIDILQHKEKSPKKAEIETLDKNWRSAQNIVDFNNELYEWISRTLEKEHRDIFGEKAKQIVQSQQKGRVKIHLIEKGVKSVFYEEVAHRMHKDIQECLRNGYDMKDITILCRNNTDIYQYIRLLSQMKVEYKGNTRYIKTISESGLTLDVSQTLLAFIHFLHWQVNPKNEQDFALMLYYLQKIERIVFQDFSEEVSALFAISSPRDRLNFLYQKYGINLQEKEGQNFNLYNSIEYILQNMAVDGIETDFILSFLESVYSLTQNAGATRKQLLKLWKDAISKQTIQVSQSLDAIQLMTIHKAKGLEFPVVFLPMNHGTHDQKFSDWFSIDTLAGVSSVNIDAFSSQIGTYDEQVKQFNEKNIYLNKIDRISLQYVATTRPVEQLILYIEKASASGEQKLEILSFIEEHCRDYISEEFDFYPNYQAQKNTSISENVERDNNASVQFLNQKDSTNITIAAPSRGYQQKNKSVRMGIFIHELLSMIHTVKDIDFAVEKYIINGVISEQEACEIKEKLRETVECNAEYFSEAYQSLNERELMLQTPTGAMVLRPDKILKNEKGFLIVDFKTGKPNEKYENQMQLYRSALENMGHTVIGTKLVFIPS